MAYPGCLPPARAALAAWAVFLVCLDCLACLPACLPASAWPACLGCLGACLGVFLACLGCLGCRVCWPTNHRGENVQKKLFSFFVTMFSSSDPLCLLCLAWLQAKLIPQPAPDGNGNLLLINK